MEEDSRLTKRETKVLRKQEKQKERERAVVIKKIKKWTRIIVVISVLFVGGSRFVKWLNTPSELVLRDVFEVADSDHTKGSNEAKLILVEYGDFQCPACASYVDAVKSVSEGFPDDLKIVYRHFPLISIHSNALPSARAAEAAGKQGMFWQMHDMLFEKQDEWSGVGNPSDLFTEYAKELGMDSDKFLVDFNSDEVKDKINKDIVYANRSKVNSTPTFFLNNEQVRLPNQEGALKNFIESKLIKLK